MWHIVEALLQVEHLTELNHAVKDTKASLQQRADLDLSAADKHAHQLAQENISLKVTAT